MGVPIIATLERQNSANFPLVKAEDILGAFATVADTTARDAIPTNILRVGAIVRIANSPVYYEWSGSAWLSLSFGSGGSLDWKDSVRFATTTALAASTRVSNTRTANANGAFPTVDGVTAAVGDRFLDKDHATGADRGIWQIVSLGSGGAPWVITRTGDADTDAEVTGGIRIPVVSGTANGGKAFKLDTADPIVLNTTALSFSVDAAAGVSDHGALTGLTDDDHVLYELAARPLHAYTGASSSPFLSDARQHITTSHGSANVFLLPADATTAFAIGTLLVGTNVGAGTMTLTADSGATVNGSVTVPQNGWWWAKKTGTNTWQTFAGGGSVTAGNGLTGTTTLSVQALDTTITVAAGGVSRPGISGDVTIATGSNVSAITAGAVVDADVNASAAIAGTKIAPDFGSQAVRTTGQFVGASSGTPTALADAGSFESCTTGSGSLRGLVCRQASADANGARVVLQKSRGTHASPAAHAADDVLAALVARSHDGSAFYDAGTFRYTAAAAGGTSKRVRIEMLMHDGAALRVVQTIDSIRQTTPNASQTTLLSIPLPTDGLYSMGVRWSGKLASGSNRAIKEMTMLVRRVGSADPTLVGSNTVTPLTRDDVSWGDDTQIHYTFNSSTDAVDFHVKGLAATNIDWDVEVSWRAL